MKEESLVSLQMYSATSVAKLLPLLIVTVGLLIDMTGADKILRQVLLWPLQPLQIRSVQLATMVYAPLRSWQTTTQAQRRVQLISQQYAVAVAQLEEMAQLKLENAALRQLVQATQAADIKRVVTTPITAFGTPAIGAGKNQGIGEHNLVLSQGIFIGRISSVENTQSQVELLTSRKSIPVLVRTENGVEGLLRGDDRRLLLTEIPLDQEVVIGQRVVTVGQIGIPGGLVVGQVAAVEPVGAASAQTARIDPLVSFFSEPIVEVRL